MKKMVSFIIAWSIAILLPMISYSQVIQGSWTLQANELSDKPGQRFTISFPAGGTLSNRLWGTDVYTADCSIATAAVHAGLITPQRGGTVTIEIRAGAASYASTTKNGVTSREWGSYGLSFVFIGTSNPPTPSPTPPAPGPVVQGNWTLQANELNGQVGQRFTIKIPGSGTLSSRLWGTDLYTADCSIATAAVHAGLITPQSGGTVMIEIRPGAASYASSTRNGVTSGAWGSYGSSFVFIGTSNPPTPPPTPPPAPGPVVQGNWTLQANELNGQVGQRFTINIPGGGTLSSRLWGTDLYTADCSIATAAVHAGLITPQRGGTVTIEIRPGAASYASSTRNGVTSGAWGSYGSSFVFIGTSNSIIQGNWNTNAVEYRGKIGQRYTFTFPGSGSLSTSIWGTSLYTDDSSIATAAVHDGLITVATGGTVTIEIRAGANAYTGSTKNGVTSRSYGAWSGSYVFVK